MLESVDIGIEQMAMGGQSGDDQLFVRFFEDAVEDKNASAKAGHLVYKDAVFIEIMQPGNTNNIVSRVARDKDKERFPRHWAAFQNRVNQEEAIEGYPIEKWPQITRGQAETLKQQGVRTVEQLANVADGAGLQILGMNQLKQQAQEFLKASEIQKQGAQMEDILERLNTLEAERDSAIEANTQMAEQLVEKQKEIDKLSAPKKRGRPPKVEPESEE